MNLTVVRAVANFLIEFPFLLQTVLNVGLDRDPNGAGEEQTNCGRCAQTNNLSPCYHCVSSNYILNFKKSDTSAKVIICLRLCLGYVMTGILTVPTSTECCASYVTFLMSQRLFLYMAMFIIFYPSFRCFLSMMIATLHFQNIYISRSTH